MANCAIPRWWRKLLTYRHRLLASPEYLATHRKPRRPRDLLSHRLLAFSRWRPEAHWNFTHVQGREKESISFEPYLAMNDYSGLAPALVEGAGIGELPPLVQGNLLAEGRLVEVMPSWRFRTLDLSVVHLGSRHIARPVGVFKEFAAQLAPKLFPKLPA